MTSNWLPGKTLSFPVFLDSDFPRLFMNAAPSSVDSLSSATPAREPSESQAALDGLLVTGLGLLWLQLYYSVTPVWIHGDYYGYAWFVPPIAVFFFYRHWQERPGPGQSRLRGLALLLATLLLLPLLVVIRAIEGFDTTWRPPMLLHALLLTVVSHWILWKRCGRGFSLGMIPVTLFALSAIPYPFTLEKLVINTLTEWVVAAAGFIFHFTGRPVQVYGSIVEFNGTKVEVTEGCSGIQSLQSLIMVSLYLGEFFRMRIPHRFLLLGLAVVAALSINVGRAIFLARVRFENGETAFDAAHDGVGHVAFAIGGLSLLVAARVMMNWGDRKKKTMRRTLSKS